MFEWIFILMCLANIIFLRHVFTEWKPSYYNPLTDKVVKALFLIFIGFHAFALTYVLVTGT